MLLIVVCIILIFVVLYSHIYRYNKIKNSSNTDYTDYMNKTHLDRVVLHNPHSCEPFVYGAVNAKNSYLW